MDDVATLRLLAAGEQNRQECRRLFWQRAAPRVAFATGAAEAWCGSTSCSRGSRSSVVSVAVWKPRSEERQCGLCACVAAMQDKLLISCPPPPPPKFQSKMAFSTPNPQKNRLRRAVFDPPKSQILAASGGRSGPLALTRGIRLPTGVGMYCYGTPSGRAQFWRPLFESSRSGRAQHERAVRLVCRARWKWRRWDNLSDHS